MGYRDWHTRKSKEVQPQQISKSIFVTNFPDHFSFRDLWKVCDVYGKMIDVFIPNRKSKSGKRFAFVRYIKIENIERLVENLCTVWIGRLRLHANVARFERVPRSDDNVPKKVNVTNKGGTYASALKMGKSQPLFTDDMKPALVLDDSCLRDQDASLHL